MKRYKFIILSVINLLLVLTVLGFSFSQAVNRKSSSYNESLDICNKSDGYSKVPLRYQLGSSFYMCAWAPKYSAIRVLIGMAGVILISLLISFIYKHRSLSFMIFSFITMLCGGFGLYSTVIDGMMVEKSKKYCEAGLNQEPSGTECNFKYFYGTIVFNMLSGLFLIVLSIVALKNRSSLFHVHEETKSLIKEDSNKSSYNDFTPTPTPTSNDNAGSGYYASGSV